MIISKDTNLQISKYLNKAEQCFLTKLPVHFIRWPPMQLIQSLALAKAKYKMQKDCSSQPIHGFSFVCFGSSIFLSALLISRNKCQDN